MKATDPRNETVIAVILASKLAHPGCSPYKTAQDARQLCRLGRTYKTQSENWCNTASERSSRRRDEVYRKACALASEYGIKLIQQDGLVLRFVDDNREYALL